MRASESAGPTPKSYEGSSDYALARIYARTFAVADDDEVIDAVLAYARADARALLRHYWHVVTALAAELDTRKTLNGQQIDETIAVAESDFTLRLGTKAPEGLGRSTQASRAILPGAFMRKGQPW